MARTSDSPAALVARYSTAIYFVAVLMILLPPLDVILSLQQYAWASARWRFGAVGLVSGAMLLPITGLLLASLTAVTAGQRLMHRIVLLAVAVLALGLVLTMVLFGLDAIQVRREANPEVLRLFDIAVVKTLLMQAMQIVAVGLIARSALRAGRSLGSARSAERTPELVAGTVGR